jgi:hypothetical protein
MKRGIFRICAEGRGKGRSGPLAAFAKGFGRFAMAQGNGGIWAVAIGLRMITSLAAGLQSGWPWGQCLAAADGCGPVPKGMTDG